MGKETKYSMFKGSKYENDIPFITAELQRGTSHSEIARGIQHNYEDTRLEAVRKWIQSNASKLVGDIEILVQNVKYKKDKQKYQDLNRIERKTFREYARVENAVTEYNKELVSILKEHGLKTQTKFFKAKNQDVKALVLQLSDLHLNELVELTTNTFDFKVAAKRLEKLAFEVIRQGKISKCNNLVIAFGGDLLNSDRRLDEMLSMSTNRAKATQISIRLIKTFMLHLNSQFNLTCVGVTGNESRAKKDLGWVDIVATDNYDYTIYDSLKIIFEGKKGFHFEMMKANEQVITIGKLNFLLIHGHQIRGDVQKSVQTIVGKYAMKGIIIHHVLAGHIHSTYNSDYFSRNSSLVGDNAYSNEALNFVSKAAQNLLIIYNDTSINSLKIDLQFTTGIKGYEIDNWLDAYNAKSAKMVKKRTRIMEVVI